MCSLHGLDFRLQFRRLLPIIPGQKLMSSVCTPKCSSPFTLIFLWCCLFYLVDHRILLNPRSGWPDLQELPGVSAGKESACRAGDLGSIPGLGQSPGERNSYPLQYSGLENSMDCIVHGVAKSQTQLSDFHFHQKLKNSKIQSLSYLKCCLTSCAYGQACNLGSVQAGQKQGQGPAFLLLKPEQDFIHFNFPNRIFMIFFFSDFVVTGNSKIPARIFC